MKRNTILLSVLVLSALTAQAEINTKEILNTKCSQCHATPNPSKYSKAEWDKRIETMALYAKLNKKEKQAIKDIKK